MARTILIITGDAGESFETLYARQRLTEAGFTPRIAAPSKRRLHLVIHDFEPGWDTYIEKPGYAAESDLDLRRRAHRRSTRRCSCSAAARPNTCATTSASSTSSAASTPAGKWVFAICHGVQILAAADLVQGQARHRLPALPLGDPGGRRRLRRPPTRPCATAASSPDRRGSRIRSSIGSSSSAWDERSPVRARGFGTAPPLSPAPAATSRSRATTSTSTGKPFCAACTSAIRQAHGDSAGGRGFPRALGAGLAPARWFPLYYLVEKSAATSSGSSPSQSASWSGGRCAGPRAAAAAWSTQLLAVALTYTAIAFSWLPFVLENNQEAVRHPRPRPAHALHPQPAHHGSGSRDPSRWWSSASACGKRGSCTAPVPLAISGPFAASGAPPVELPRPPAVPACRRCAVLPQCGADHRAGRR